MKLILSFSCILAASLVLSACLPGEANPVPLYSPDVENGEQRFISRAEVAANDSRESCWTIIDGKVYDVTSAIDSHPGGEAILQGCGQDSTELFKGVRQHGSPANQASLDELQIGVLVETSE